MDLPNMLPNATNPIEYVRARICVPKQFEQALYGALPCVTGDAITFVQILEALYQTGISDAEVNMYNAFYRSSGLQLDTELDYDLPTQPVDDFIQYVELCTGGSIKWLVLMFAEIKGWDAFHKIESAIACDPILKNCASIER
jgi:hypothetical protein